MYSLVLLRGSFRPSPSATVSASKLTSRIAARVATGDYASPAPNLRGGKCLNFQRKTGQQLKLSKLTTLKGLKLSKMSKLMEVVLLANICVKVAGDSSQGNDGVTDAGLAV